MAPQVKTYTYKKLLGTFRLDSWTSDATMDDHMAQLLGDGWEAGPPVLQSGNGKVLGNIVPDKMIVTYTKKD